MSDLHHRLIEFLMRYRQLCLVVAVLLTVAAGPVASRLEFDQSIESLYAEDDPHLRQFLQSKAWFGGDEFVIVAFEIDPLFTADNRQLTESAERQIGELTALLNAVPGVQPESTQDLASALENRLVRLPFIRQRVRSMLEEILVGGDGRTTAIVLRLLPESKSSVSRADTIAKIRRIARNRSADAPTYVVGEPVQIHDMFRYVEEDGGKLFAWSLIVLAVVLLALFRNLRWVVLPIIVVTSAITLTEALLVLAGTQLSMVSSMLNSLVTIIGVATVTHIAVHYGRLRDQHDPVPALRQALRDLLPAIFWTCATTAAGFAALLSSGITPVRSFGLMMSLATMLVLAATAIIVPGGVLLGGRGIDPLFLPAQKQLGGALAGLARIVHRHPRIVAAVAAMLVVLSAAGLGRLRVETDFSKNFREQSDIVKSLRFVESRLGGAGTWEVNFPAPASLDDEFLEKLEELTDALREQSGDGPGQLTKVVSLMDGLELIRLNPLFGFRSIDRQFEALAEQQPEYATGLYNANAGRMRIVLRALEQQNTESKNALIANVERIANQHMSAADNRPAVSTTGIFVLLTFLIDSLLSDQLVSLCLAAAGIVLMMSLAFRSFSIGLLSLIPNLFPIVLVIGCMGWIGLPINIATAMIASVSLGLTVDSSIHYISGFRRELRAGLSVPDALAATHQSVGRALVFANFALICGFAVLTLSHFIPLVYFGVLVSVAMLGGLAGNLMLLPMLLRINAGGHAPVVSPETAAVLPADGP